MGITQKWRIGEGVRFLIRNPKIVSKMGLKLLNWQRCMWLKGVVLRAHYNGKILRNPFAQFHISPNCKEREFLTEDELKAVVTHEFEDDNLAFARDIFVFVCFTVLSFIYHLPSMPFSFCSQQVE